MKIMYSELTGCYYAVEGKKKTDVTAEIEAAQNKKLDELVNRFDKETSVHPWIKTMLKTIREDMRD